MILSFTTMVKKYNMDIKGIIHIGAHRGQEIEEYVDNGIQDIIMFEPVSLNFNILEKRMADVNANISAYQVALGNEEKNVTMYLSDNDLISSSVLRPKVHLQLHPGVGFPGTEEVEMKRLDSFAEETQNFNFINMDVQGYELEVLKGGAETLKHVDYVYCEINRDELYEGNAFVEDLDEFLSGYSMERVETDWAGTLWGDALYVRK
ncbi:methyltransferase [Synechococcus phage S-SRM01]|uniref:FkbM family methyltransferase n=1 Tax=Synechococcus phage S-SRM01 TaxID=2781608 RepID=A0A879R262_9CAUD|nr:methyltransferase [Synechococcus phage S-SRM01]QPX48273.1 FkbM family methyltransferase [Synechococcus phage S-SRM01]